METHPAVRPFRVNVPEEDLDDLRRRIAATRWPSKELVEDRSQGVQLATLQALARYWTTDYDWRKAEDHKKDLEVQHKHGAKALKYWFSEEKGEVYCLFEAPNSEAAEAVHREAHGNVADEIMEVEEGS
jgi:hypothetical protein